MQRIVLSRSNFLFLGTPIFPVACPLIFPLILHNLMGGLNQFIADVPKHGLIRRTNEKSLKKGRINARSTKAIGKSKPLVHHMEPSALN